MTPTLSHLSVDELAAERLVLLEEAQAIGKKAEAGTALSAEEIARFEELTCDGGLVEQATATWQAQADFKARLQRAEENLHEARAWSDSNTWTFGPTKHEPATDGEYRAGKQTDAFAVLDADGKWHQAKAATQPISQERPKNAPSAGELLAFWATNDEKHLQGKDPMAATTGHSGGSAGGYLIPSTISGEIVDKARAQMVTGRAGTRTIALTSAEMSIVKVANDPSGGFYRELAPITASRTTFEQIVLRPHKYAVLLPISREAIEDSQNLPGILQTTAQAAIAQAVDQAVLRGDGVSEPRGILNTTGVNTTTTVGTPSSYGEILGSVRKVYDANFSGNVSELAWIHSPREWETYANLTATDGQPLQMPPKVTDLPSYATTAMPVTEGDGEDESSMIVGHFPSSVLAFRSGGGVSVDFLDAGSAVNFDGGTINAVTQDDQWLRFTLRFDVAVLRPDHFTVLSGVTAS